jgi:hypothetical protein
LKTPILDDWGLPAEPKPTERGPRKLGGLFRSFSFRAPGEHALREILEALQGTPLVIFRDHVRRLVRRRPRIYPDVAGWIELARTCAESFRQSETSLASREKERLIALPFAERFPDPAELARYDLSLRRKASSEAQLAIVRDVIERSFAGDWAIWVKAGSAELAWKTGFPRETLALALWLAVIAGLVERRRIDGVWHYTAVPEAWAALPDYDPPAAEPREIEVSA